MSKSRKLNLNTCCQSITFTNHTYMCRMVVPIRPLRNQMNICVSEVLRQYNSSCYRLYNLKQIIFYFQSLLPCFTIMFVSYLPSYKSLTLCRGKTFLYLISIQDINFHWFRNSISYYERTCGYLYLSLT